ncbi:MAG TPA: type II secretion system F family protein [Spirochaetia bacterium]
MATPTGKIEESIREAASEESCLRELSAQGGFVLSIREAGHGATGSGRISRKALSEITDLVSLMLSSGLSLKDSLEVAQGIFTRGESNELVSRLLERIRKGSTFAAALAASGTGVPPFYVGMVKIGERIGTLDQVFARLSVFLKEEKALRDRFSSAMIYPAIVLGVAVMAAAFIVVFLFPRLRDIFASVGPSMAGRVEGLMASLNVAIVVVGVVLVVLAVAVAALAAVRRAGGPPAVRIDAFMLSLPVVAPLLLRRELLNFTFAMEALTAAGVGVEEALSEGAGALTNRALGDAVAGIRERLMKGEKLSSAFAATRFFPERMARWMAVGERVGHVEKVFGQLRAYYQQEVEKWISRVMALIEPVLIVGLGVFIVLFVVFFIVPIFSLFGNVM